MESVKRSSFHTEVLVYELQKSEAKLLCTDSQKEQHSLIRRVAMKCNDEIGTCSQFHQR